MPENAKIAWIEDDPVLIKLDGGYLERRGHQLIAIAQNETEAETLIDEIIAGKLEVDVIIMDGRLNSEEEYNHGEYYSRILKENGIETPIIGYSGSKAPWSDIDVGKFAERTDLNNAITEL